MIGILTPFLIATTPPTPNQWVQELRTWEAEQTRTDPEESINKSLEQLEWETDGSDGATEQEELLQFPSDKDRKSIGRGYDRCSDRSWIRFIQKRTGKNCRS